MIIKEEPIEFKKLSYYCDICNTELEDTLTALTSFPPIKIFRCPKCNREYRMYNREYRIRNGGDIYYDKY